VDEARSVDSLALLSEFYVVNFPGGVPPPYAVPMVYKHIATLPPGAVLSLPDYARTPMWFREADYQYFSTAHWHAIVNGDSREWPPQFVSLTERLKTFPDGAAASTMRVVGVRYVVLHADRDGASDLLAPALASSDFRLLARLEHDHLFQVTPAATR
jgi:hypothetical protein